jgi:hypothetical protein
MRCKGPGPRAFFVATILRNLDRQPTLRGLSVGHPGGRFPYSPRHARHRRARRPAPPLPGRRVCVRASKPPVRGFDRPRLSTPRCAHFRARYHRRRERGRAGSEGGDDQCQSHVASGRGSTGNARRPARPRARDERPLSALRPDLVPVGPLVRPPDPAVRRSAPGRVRTKSAMQAMQPPRRQDRGHRTTAQGGWLETTSADVTAHRRPRRSLSF